MSFSRWNAIWNTPAKRRASTRGCFLSQHAAEHLEARSLLAAGKLAAAIVSDVASADDTQVAEKSATHPRKVRAAESGPFTNLWDVNAAEAEFPSETQLDLVQKGRKVKGALTVPGFGEQGILSFKFKGKIQDDHLLGKSRGSFGLNPFQSIKFQMLFDLVLTSDTTFEGTVFQRILPSGQTYQANLVGTEAVVP